ncbi:phospholipase/carboxylesterase, partial [Tremellales sp. Uapishka_1]
MASTSLKHLKIAPKDAHTGTVIFLHGLGDSGHGWLPVAKMLWANFPGVKWVLPHAPSIPITVNGGMSMPGWFDLSTLDKITNSKNDDERGLLASVSSIEALIQSEIDSGIPSERIVVGGFSQGGAVAILTGLLSKRKLGGVAALSTWVPLNHKIESMTQSDAKDIPVFWGHGKDDPVVQYRYGVQSVELLTKKLGFPLVDAGKTFQRPGLRFESYPNMGHSSCPKEIEDFKSWLGEVFK